MGTASTKRLLTHQGPAPRRTQTSTGNQSNVSAAERDCHLGDTSRETEYMDVVNNHDSSGSLCAHACMIRLRHEGPAGLACSERRELMDLARAQPNNQYLDAERIAR